MARKPPPPTIRFEEWDEAPRQELDYNLQARVLELKSWIYRPFVYYAIHCGDQEEEEMAPCIEQFVQKAIASSFHITQSKQTTHRHHGSWFAARNVLGSALVILAAVKAGDLADYLVDWPDLVAQAIKSLDHWASESVDLAEGRDVLVRLLDLLSTSGST